MTIGARNCVYHLKKSKWRGIWRISCGNVGRSIKSLSLPLRQTTTHPTPFPPRLVPCAHVSPARKKQPVANRQTTRNPVVSTTRLCRLHMALAAAVLIASPRVEPVGRDDGRTDERTKRNHRQSQQAGSRSSQPGLSRKQTMDAPPGAHRSACEIHFAVQVNGGHLPTASRPTSPPTQNGYHGSSGAGRMRALPVGSRRVEGMRERIRHSRSQWPSRRSQRCSMVRCFSVFSTSFVELLLLPYAVSCCS